MKIRKSELSAQEIAPGYATLIAVIKSANERGLDLTLIRNGYMSDTFSSHAIGKNGHTLRDRSFFVRKIRSKRASLMCSQVYLTGNLRKRKSSEEVRCGRCFGLCF